MPSVVANGIEMHYVEAGSGVPLVLVDNAMVSSNPIWAGHPSAYRTHLDAFAEHFHVVLPDNRGSGQTVHPGGPISHRLLADDLIAMIDALGLDRPLICGFSDGAEVASIVGIRSPASVRAIVNHSGYELFSPDPQAPGIVLTRQMLGGHPDATHADLAALTALAEQVDELRVLCERMSLDHDAAQGAGHWQHLLGLTYERISRPHGYTIADLDVIIAPTLVLVGDRDPFCSVEEAAAFARALPDGELAVLPGTDHVLDAASVRVAIDFFRRRLDDPVHSSSRAAATH